MYDSARLMISHSKPRIVLGSASRSPTNLHVYGATPLTPNSSHVTVLSSSVTRGALPQRLSPEDVSYDRVARLGQIIYDFHGAPTGEKPGLVMGRCWWAGPAPSLFDILGRGPARPIKF